MPRIYVRTGEPTPGPEYGRRNRLRAARAEKTAEYQELRRQHGRRADVAKQLSAITCALLKAELRELKPASDPPRREADLFAI